MNGDGSTVKKLPFNSRRSCVYSTSGMAASSQASASSAGSRILRLGGNAVDAAVAQACVLAVAEPCSTGIGGDCFALFYDADSKVVTAMLGNGAAPAALSLEFLTQQGISSLHPTSPHTVTVPGACAAWVDAVEKFGSGSVSLDQILQPAIELAENGVPIGPVTAAQWKASVGMCSLLDVESFRKSVFVKSDGSTPEVGELFRNIELAETLKEVSKNGKKGFYEGRIAESIVKEVKNAGGVLSLEDLKAHQTEFCSPISVSYRGIQVFEVPPPTQGLSALIALNIIENFPISEMNEIQRTHVMIEAMRLAFADANAYVGDPRQIPMQTKIDALLEKSYAKSRAGLIDLEKCAEHVEMGRIGESETVQFCAVDRFGNACSMINSNFMGFGTGLVPKGCGFSLQNRGLNFTLEPNHPNCLQPRKRPFHTIIPGLATRDGDLFGVFGCMGGFMQPQGHMQLISNMIDLGMDPQSALDAPRFCVGSSYGQSEQHKHLLHLELGFSASCIHALKEYGHNTESDMGDFERSMFGRGQIILRNPENGVLVAGSDPRADGCAVIG
uniref:Gamma-glutamyltransferase n=1 Tax=Timspurckia oligopyrenoides TaxID=708627 RepID=A0A7S1EUA9_9RHOD